jgi:hypothetical protein
MARHPAYQHEAPLAHTDFDPDNREDRERDHSLKIRRPSHAPTSAYYGRAFFVKLLTTVPVDQRAYVASACAAAVLAHHGGWWLSELELSPPTLCLGWKDAVLEAVGSVPDENELASLRKYRVDKLLEATTGPESLADWWPLVAYLTRTLRLSDQRATAERGCNE